MPSISQSYEVILDFTNDTHDSATVQLLRDYGRPSNRIILLNPGETMSLVLDAGDTYKYTLKTKSKVVNITARAWRDVVCGLSQIFLPVTPDVPLATCQSEFYTLTIPFQSRMSRQISAHPPSFPHTIFIEPLQPFSAFVSNVYILPLWRDEQSTSVRAARRLKRDTDTAAFASIDELSIGPVRHHMIPLVDLDW